MNKRDIKNIVLLLMIALYIVCYKQFIFSNYMKYSAIITASFFAILLALAIYFLGWRKDKLDFYSRNILKIVLFFISIAFIGMYGLGFFVGFLKNGYSLKFLTLLDNILAPILIIVLGELFRYVFIWANRDKKFFIFVATIGLIAMEWVVSVRTIPFGDVEELFRISTATLLPSLLKHIVLSYLCYHSGYKAPLVYRLIMDIYLFVVPIVPDIGDYLNSIILIALPFMIYINASSYVEDREKKAEYSFEENVFSIWDIPIAAFLIVLAALVSGFFPHYIMGVGSESMTPTINKGDAVILHKLSAKEKSKLKEGDIIAFKNEDKIVIHRIQEVTEAGGRQVFVTKGDANNSIDTNVVSGKQIQGIVQLRVPFIAIPTVYLQETLNK